MLPTTLNCSYHKDYRANLFIWSRTRDAVAGESRIKSKHTVYLPMPSAMLDNPPAVSVQQANLMTDMNSIAENPNKHINEAYSAYLSRAEFPEITQFILRGLLGLTNAETPTIVLPERLEYLKDSCTSTGLSLADFYMYAISEVLTTGRFPVILDISAEGKIIFAPIVAESLEDWKSSGGLSAEQSGIQAALIKDFDFEPSDIFGVNPTVVRKLAIVDDGFYTVAKYIENTLADQTQPTYQNKKLTYVPMVCIGSITNTLSVDPSPLSPIAASAVQIYMKNADLSNAEFLTCNPTLVLSGVMDNSKPTAIGSSICWIFPDPEAKAEYTKTDTSALSHMLNHINNIYEQAIYQGAQLLDSSKKASESAETARLKQAASGATLLNVVNNVKEGFLKLLQMVCEWSNADFSEVQFMPLTEFMSPTMSAPEQNALVESWMSGAISHRTLLDNFRKAGLLITGETVESEMARAKKEHLEVSAIKSKDDPTDEPTDEPKDDPTDEPKDKDPSVS